jgi:hypothetical protein
VAIAVVVILEAVDVRKQHCDALLFAHRLLPNPRDMLIEHAAVLDAGQTVARDHFAQQARLQETQAAGLFVHVGDRRAEQVGGDEGHGAVAELTARQFQHDARGKIGQHYDDVGRNRMVENQPAHEVDEYDAEDHTRDQQRDPAPRGNDLNGGHAQAKDGHDGDGKRRVNPVAMPRETARQTDEQDRNDDENLNAAGGAVELRSQDHRVHRRKCDRDEDCETKVHARVQQVLVEISAPELRLELAVECQPRKSGPQLPRVGRIG